eukprot:scaffold907_cov144-Skeletonema_menzelii.AAC.6
MSSMGWGGQCEMGKLGDGRASPSIHYHITHSLVLLDNTVDSGPYTSFWAFSKPEPQAVLTYATIMEFANFIITMI